MNAALIAARSRHKKEEEAMRCFVFHLMRMHDQRLVHDVRLRYDFDPRCYVEKGDVWSRVDVSGCTTRHAVTETRIFLGVDGEELHIFTSPQAVVSMQ